MLIKAFNPPLEDLEKTHLTTDVSSTGTTLTVKNTNSFTANQKLLIGEMGHEHSEIRTLSSVGSDTSLTIDALDFDHPTGTPVYELRYDQVKFYRSTTGIDGTYSALATVNIDVDNDNQQTTYDDTTGLSSYYYKVSYYDSVGTEETDKSDPIAGSGYDRTKVGYVLDVFSRRTGDREFETMSVDEALDLLNDCNDQLLIRVKKPYRFLYTSDTLDTTASQAYVDLDDLTDTIWKFDRVVYNYVSGGTDIENPLEVIPHEEYIYRFADNNAADDDNLRLASIDHTTNRLYLYPAPESAMTGKIRIYYYKKFTTLDSFNDTLEVPVASLYIDWLLAHYYRVKSIQDSSYQSLSDRYMGSFEQQAIRLPQHNKLDVGTPKSFKLKPQSYKGQRS